MLARATPLVALDAVAIDTETTGLNPDKARIVQIGAVRIRAGRVCEAETFLTLVDPGEPIPAGSTAIHGIGDGAVAGAPGFAEAFAALRTFAGGDVVVGQHVTFDLAAMAAECRRSGIAHDPPPALDTALLAAVARRDLPDTSLEVIADWLGVAVAGRHTAAGDALTAARIFVALVPVLRERGIRTVGEADAACRLVAGAMQAAGRPVAEIPPAGEVRPPGRLDPSAYRHRVGEVMSSPPRLIGAERPLGDAVHVMSEARVSSLFVSRAGEAKPYGIITERDVMRAIADGGPRALDRPVESAASSPLIAIPASDFAYRAIGRLTRHGIRHLAVTDAAGAVVGALSARDLLRSRIGDAVALGDAIADAADVAALAAAWARVPVVARGLIEEGVAGADVTAVVSREIGAMTRRAGELAAARLEAAGEGPPPAPFALAVLGSAGRDESMLAPDQDNALVHAGDAAADAWFAVFGRQVADILDEAGIPRCKGGVMASNAEWRGSVADWEGRVATWVGRSSARDLLNVDIFFDLLPVAGDTQLAEDVWCDACAAAKDEVAFLKLLAESAAGFAPPLTLFGRLRTEEGRIDLKKGGLFPIVAAARLLAIRYGVPARGTDARLAGVRDRGVGSATDLDRLIEVRGILVDAILRQQVADIAAGVPPSNRVAPSTLTPACREDLRAALASLRDLDATLRDLLFGGS